MKNILIIGFLITLATHGCHEENDYDFLITKAGDTIYIKDVEASWTRFKFESDSTLYDADVKISAAIQALHSGRTQNTLALWAKILRAEQLVERLGEKQERGRQFDEMVNIDEKELLKMEVYKKDYKKLENKLNHAIEKIHTIKVAE